MKISELSVDYVSFDDDDKEISAIAISYKDNSGKEQRRWLEKPRRIGYWKKHPHSDDKYESYTCSCCRRNLSPTNEYRFCPNCGVKMGGTMESNRIEYTSKNGYTGVLYGTSSLSVKKGGNEVLHTGFRNINTYDELVEYVEDFPRLWEILTDNIEEINND